MVNQIHGVILTEEGLQCKLLLDGHAILNRIRVSPHRLWSQRKIPILIFCGRLEGEFRECLQRIIPKIHLCGKVLVLNLIVVNRREGGLRSEQQQRCF